MTASHPNGIFDLRSSAMDHSGPQLKSELVRPHGQKYYYGDVTLVGTCDLESSDFDPTKPTPYGLAPFYTAWYGYLRSESGIYYYPQRLIQGPMVPRLSLTMTAGREFAVDVPEAATSFKGYVHADASGDSWKVVSLGNRRRPRMGFELDPRTGGMWAEEDLLQLEFQVLGPAMQIYHPDPVCDMYFRQLLYRCEGTIGGERVRGIGGVEQAWGDGGHNWMDLPMYQRVEDQWIYSVIEYTDGGVEASSMFTSLDGRHGAGIQIEDAEARAVYAPSSQPVPAEDGLPGSTVWCFGGESRTDAPRDGERGIAPNAGRAFLAVRCDEPGQRACGVLVVRVRRDRAAGPRSSHHDHQRIELRCHIE